MIKKKWLGAMAVALILACGTVGSAAYAAGGGRNYRDADLDGVCDNFVARGANVTCKNYVDEDENGICDNYVDEDENGICDNSAGRYENSGGCIQNNECRRKSQQCRRGGRNK